MTDSLPTGPHAAIPVHSEQERCLARLFDRLWVRYRERVEYVRRYEQVVAAAGGTFVNDHIAFRTFAGQQPTTGIVSLSRLFEALGYVAAGCYQFPDKHLSAIHFQHPNGQFPKLFISELQVWRLSERSQHILGGYLRSHRAPVSDSTLARLSRVTESTLPDLVETCAEAIERRPWDRPEKSDVQELNRESQYAAWTLVHGYNVNHFTSLVNSHGVDALNDIEKTIAALKTAGIPMKAEIEGARGSKLRQTATEAVTIDVEVSDHGLRTMMPWSYAYFELAERGEVADAETGRHGRFEGFLGPQATQLFEMTKVA
uniref:2-oxoadipate dioxygenase/decarboxylase n=1 Tax=Schlesneria paludicola TaxID=360056 RepID=A0A7C2JY45_9PLAN